MATILSQDEIDALLNNINTGQDQPVEEEIQETEYKVFDFRTANKFSKDQIKTLNIIIDNYCGALNTKLTAMFRSTCEAKVLSIEEQKFGEFSNSIPTPSIIGVIDDNCFDGSYLICVSPYLAYAMIAKVFGGVARNINMEKTFSEIELAVFKNLYKPIVSCFKTAWDKIANISPVLKRLETSSQFCQITALNEPVALITLSIRIDDVEDILNICIPYVAMQPIVKKLNSAAWTLASSTRATKEVKKELILKDINETECELTALFNDTIVTFGDVSNLKVGDVINLDHLISEYINVEMDGKLKYNGIIGVNGNKKVLQIAKIVKESEDSE